MPVELRSVEEFKEVAKKAIECRVKKVRNSDTVKLKARTKKYLYTIKVKENEADSIIKEAGCKKIVYVDEGRVIEQK